MNSCRSRRVRSLYRSDADFILLVEKEAAYMRMAEDRFYQKYPCIVITAKGQPVSLKKCRNREGRKYRLEM